MLYRATPLRDVQQGGGLGRCLRGPQTSQSYQSKGTAVPVHPGEHFRVMKPLLPEVTR